MAYQLTVDKLQPEDFRVGIHLRRPEPGAVTFRMPRWLPGSYRLRNYGEQVQGFSAHDEQGKSLPLTRIDMNSWQVKGASDSIFVSYEVKYASQFWSGPVLDSTYVFIDGPAVFMYVDKLRTHPATLALSVTPDWQVATSLARNGSETNRFTAGNYDQLIDCPIQMGNVQRCNFYLKGRPIELVFNGNVAFEPDSFALMVKRICAYQADFFNEVPFNHYVFLYRLLPQNRGGGGLEHRTSTAIALHEARVNVDFFSAAEITAHEFFHVWNIKKFYPGAFAEIDYSKPARCRSLWFSEGVTSYYEALTLMRTKLWRPGDFLQEMAAQIMRLQETAERHYLSVADASWQIWERGYGHPGLSFYNKGQLLGLLLDLRIRYETAGARSLDDLVRALNQEYSGPPGFTDNDLAAQATAIAGCDLSDFFEDFVNGTVELPYDDYLGFAGLELRFEEKRQASIGRLVFAGPANRVVHIDPHSSAFAAGLRKGDYLVTVSGRRFDSGSSLQNILSGYWIGEPIEVSIRRDGRELRLQAVVTADEIVKCQIGETPDPTDFQELIKDGLFNGTNDRQEDKAE